MQRATGLSSAATTLARHYTDLGCLSGVIKSAARIRSSSPHASTTAAPQSCAPGIGLRLKEQRKAANTTKNRRPRGECRAASGPRGAPLLDRSRSPRDRSGVQRDTRRPARIGRRISTQASRQARGHAGCAWSAEGCRVGGRRCMRRRPDRGRPAEMHEMRRRLRCIQLAFSRVCLRRQPQTAADARDRRRRPTPRETWTPSERSVSARCPACPETSHRASTRRSRPLATGLRSTPLDAQRAQATRTVCHSSSQASHAENLLAARLTYDLPPPGPSCPDTNAPRHLAHWTPPLALELDQRRPQSPPPQPSLVPSGARCGPGGERRVSASSGGRWSQRPLVHAPCSNCSTARCLFGISWIQAPADLGDLLLHFMHHCVVLPCCFCRRRGPTSALCRHTSSARSADHH